jgi:hypothetical protein
MPQILPSSSWVEFRGVPKVKTLHASEIHFAIVKDLGGKDRKCAVKFIDLQTSNGLICEGVGWLLAKACGVNVPPFASILMVPIQKLSNSMAVPTWLHGYNEYPAWCLEIVEGDVVAHVHSWSYWLSVGNCLKAKNTPVLASFDLFADNRDRNFGNVIKSTDGKYVAIDHELLLYELLHLPMNRQFKLNSLLEFAEQTLTAELFLKFKCEMATAVSMHESAILSIQSDAMAFLATIISDSSQSQFWWSTIESFLISRAQVGWMSNKLGVIV